MNPLQHMKLARSVQQNIAYGTSLFRSGETRFPSGNGKGGFNPAFLAPLAPYAIKYGEEALDSVFKSTLPHVEKGIHKFFNWLGLGRGGALYRSGGFWNKPGDIGMPLGQKRDPRYSAMAGGSAIDIADIPKKYQNYLSVLESKLTPLSSDPEAFVRKLIKIRSVGKGYFKRHIKREKAKGKGVKKYKYSKRYKALKAKHYKKYPKATHGKYYRSAKYKNHKVKYADYRKKKVKS
jgi:hypothetical protein